MKNVLIISSSPRACLKIHFRHLHTPLCGIFDPNSVNVAHYASLIRAKSPTNWSAHLTKSNFQTHSRKGNSQRLCEEFKKGAEESGNFVELIRDSPCKSEDKDK